MLTSNVRSFHCEGICDLENKSNFIVYWTEYVTSLSKNISN